jgi:hypothetical protein
VPSLDDSNCAEPERNDSSMAFGHLTMLPSGPKKLAGSV